MTWFKVDDKLHDHRKARKAGKSAMGVWVLAGSWSMDNESDGFVPDEVLSRWGTRADAARLVAAGLWDIEQHQGEHGWRFHDWSHFQPSAAVTAAKKASEREAGLRGNHKRWHVERQISDPDCDYCYRVPDGEPDEHPIGGGESAPIRPVPVPDPVPIPSPNGEGKLLAIAERTDVTRICDHLADRIAEDGSKRPPITKGWLDAGRLLLDRDGRTEVEVHAGIDWCQDSNFWRPNILSMPKFREKYDQLRKQAIAERERPRGGRAQEQSDLLTRAMARAEAKMAKEGA